MKAFETIMTAEFPEYFGVQVETRLAANDRTEPRYPAIIYIRDDDGYLVEAFLVNSASQAAHLVEALPDGWVAGTE